MTERIVNVCWEPDEDNPNGHTSIYRPVDDQHEERLLNNNEFSEKVVAEASPLACPIAEVSNPQFCEEKGFVPTWIGMKRGEK